MPLFHIDGQELSLVKPTQFSLEKQLQNLVEANLETLFSCRLVASEFSTGVHHAGRIDTLALTEDGNPAIIEYKKVESSELINQSLFYLHWLDDHRGDFQVAAQAKLGNKIEIDWSDIRVICIAPGYKKFDLLAVQKMGANIELWKYRSYSNSSILFEEVNEKQGVSQTSNGKNPAMVSAGKKAAETRRTGTYSFEEHLDGKPEPIQSLARSLQEYCNALGEAVEEVPKKLYVAYRTNKNFLTMIVQKKSVYLYLHLDPQETNPLPDNARDVSNIGHWGTGDLELEIKSTGQVEQAKPLIKRAFEKLGE